MLVEATTGYCLGLSSQLAMPVHGVPTRPVTNWDKRLSAM